MVFNSPKLVGMYTVFHYQNQFKNHHKIILKKSKMQDITVNTSTISINKLLTESGIQSFKI